MGADDGGAQSISEADEAEAGRPTRRRSGGRRGGGAEADEAEERGRSGSRSRSSAAPSRAHGSCSTRAQALRFVDLSLSKLWARDWAARRNKGRRAHRLRTSSSEALLPCAMRKRSPARSPCAQLGSVRQHRRESAQSQRGGSKALDAGPRGFGIDAGAYPGRCAQRVPRAIEVVLAVELRTARDGASSSA